MLPTTLHQALVAIEAEGLHVVFPEPLEPHAERLLRTLGVTWSVDPSAPRLAAPLDSYAVDSTRLKRDCPWRR